ncbi:hypothetical protein B484DRAFT_444340 [Ochromonadaceae sp. CCMP2298]|nr:hypothetical protein B484DRAFT_444340 [Ochromonadaceae sp. CCMP2298]|mmetsp:Transcript_26796/g.57757  ORF Transcript_26796/g.57757 Transcript_26796/m.57757 type:complete len:121 (+) Transcript_26796:32-394(+)
MPPKLADSVNLPPSTFSTHHAPPARPVRFASQEQGQGRGGTSMGMSAGAKGWACSVCRFAQNPEQAQMCSVCDAPNYSQHKEHQVTEQCSNCRFANAQAADECEMCGEPLAGSRGNYRHK